MGIKRVRRRMLVSGEAGRGLDGEWVRMDLLAKQEVWPFFLCIVYTLCGLAVRLPRVLEVLGSILGRNTRNSGAHMHCVMTLR